MKAYFLLILCFFSNNLIGQEPATIKGVKPAAGSLTASTGITRAVIIGISDYQHPQIPDLQYAHKDAAAFKAYLQSPAGGNLPNDNIQLLTNADATTGKMAAALDWLIEMSQEKDKAIIYFSGHGDVEKKTVMQHGFLLTYDAPANVYMAGAFPVFYLQSIISTLSSKEVQTVLITDACRAGKLAGSAVNGAQATTAALSQQFANEIKILSCQPDEYSVEGEQWGQGRGCFSYHLINGLIGLADKNQDATVSLKEVERYLEDKVAEEVAPQIQNPFAIGKSTTQLGIVDEIALAELKAQEQFNQPQFNVVKGKGTESLDGLTEESKQLITTFIAYLEKGKLLSPKEACAERYYQQILSTPELTPFYTQMTRGYAAALIDDAQQYINLMLAGDARLIDTYAYQRSKQVDLYPAYLQRATALLSPKHYLYKSLKQKEYFFKGIALKDQLLTKGLSKKKAKQITKLALINYQQALTFDTTAAYVHLALANVYMEQQVLGKSNAHIDKAIFYAPNWALAIATKGIISAHFGKHEAAIEYFEQALSIDKTQFFVYQWLATENRNIGKTAAAQSWNTQQIHLIDSLHKINLSPAYYKGLLAVAHSELGNYAEASTLFKQVNQENLGKDATLLHAEALNYYWAKNFVAAKNNLQKALNLNATANSWTLMALINMELGNNKLAKKALKKARKINDQFPYTYFVQGQLAEQKQAWEPAKINYQKAFKIAPFQPQYWRQLLSFYETRKASETEIDELFTLINSLNPGNPAIIKAFALTCQRMGFRKKARVYLKKSLFLK